MGDGQQSTSEINEDISKTSAKTSVDKESTPNLKQESAFKRKQQSSEEDHAFPAHSAAKEARKSPNMLFDSHKKTLMNHNEPPLS